MAVTEGPGDRDHDRSCLRRAQAGDAEAFCALVSPFQERLLRQACGLCRDAATAEDLVVETLAEAWRSIGRFDGSCRFSTWLFAILVHRHQKAARRAWRWPVPLSSLSRTEAEVKTAATENLADAAAMPDEASTRAELGSELRAAIDRLPEAQRHVILLRFFEDASLQDIAVLTGVSPGTVKSRLHYALRKLREIAREMNLFENRGDT
jgi:RNA polymerase sigma-70 factor (ECF subfamily)